MNAFLESVFALAPPYRSAVQIGLSVLLQSTLLLLLGLLLGRALHRHGPTFSSLLYRATLAGTVLSALFCILCAGRLQPLWKLTLPAPHDAITPGDGDGMNSFAVWPSAQYPPARIRQTPVESVSTQVDTWRNAPAAKGFNPSPSVNLPPISRTSRIEGFFVGAMRLYAGGALLLLAWLSVCHLSLLRLRKQSAPIVEDDALDTLRTLCADRCLLPPALLSSAHVQSPFLAGLRHPVVFLPASYATDFDAVTLRAILAHELTHLERRDPLWSLLARLVCAVGWMQPLLWVLCRQMEQASEEACDQAVLAEDCPPQVYARCLLSLAERRARSRAARVAGVGVVAFRSALGRRVQRILSDTRRVPPISARLRACIVTGTLAIAVSCAWLVSATATPRLPAPPTLPPAPPAATKNAIPTPSIIAGISPSRVYAAPAVAIAKPPKQKPAKTSRPSQAEQVRIAGQRKQLQDRELMFRIRIWNVRRAATTRQLAKTTAQLALLEAEYAALQTKYSDSHPQIRKLLERKKLLELQSRELQIQRAALIQQLTQMQEQLRTELDIKGVNSVLLHGEAKKRYEQKRRQLAESMARMSRDLEGEEIDLTPRIKAQFRQVEFGVEHDNQKMDKIIYSYEMSRAIGFRVVVGLSVIAEYYDAEDKPLTQEFFTGAWSTGMVSQTSAADQEVTAYRGGIPMEVRQGAPKGAVTARYYYELRASLFQGTKAVANDSEISDAHVLDLGNP